jgi:hypothetical protein
VREPSLSRPWNHRFSHDELLRTPVTRADRLARLDAIVVPSRRPAEHLEHAANLAARLNATLVVLCSKDLSSRQAVEFLDRRHPGARAVAIDVNAQPGHPIFCHASTDQRWAWWAPYRRVASARNLALALAWSMRWRMVLFLDDDISGLSIDSILRAAGTVSDDRRARGAAPVDVVGWRVNHFPDNSVVCHAARIAGLPQRVFIGSGALLVGIHRDLGFFPPIYNEDWLFLFDALERRSVCVMPDEENVIQLSYDPFSDQSRADAEEFGDCFAEGLFERLHERPPTQLGPTGRLASAVDDLSDPTRGVSYWSHIVAGRGRLISEIEARLVASRSDSSLYPVDVVRGALAVSGETLSRIDPEYFALFLRAWRRDLTMWRAGLDHLPRQSRIDEALDLLGVERPEYAAGMGHAS